MFAMRASPEQRRHRHRRGRERLPCVWLVVPATLATSVLTWAAPPAGPEIGNTPTPAAESRPSAPPARPAAHRILLRGRVVFVRDALKELGIPAYEELNGQVALHTDDGELLPIVPDWRGRAFFQDARLRNRPVELVVRRYDKIPYLQVLMIFVRQGDKRLYMDYWCDVCSIPMYEIKPCDCCQGPTRLRLTPRPLPAYLTDPAKADGKVSTTPDTTP